MEQGSVGVANATTRSKYPIHPIRLISRSKFPYPSIHPSVQSKKETTSPRSSRRKTQNAKRRVKQHPKKSYPHTANRHYGSQLTPGSPMPDPIFVSHARKPRVDAVLFTLPRLRTLRPAKLSKEGALRRVCVDGYGFAGAGWA
jgi:hypothetical protein